MDIIIPVKNDPENLKKCVASLREQTIPTSIFVVSPNFSDELIQLAKENSIELVLEPQSNIKGSRRGLACNAGLLFSHSAIVGFVDSDTIVPPQWAESLSKYLNGNVAGVTSGCVQKDSPSNMLMNLVSTHARDFAKIEEVQSIPGYNAMYLRKAIDNVGRFNAKIGGCEDWELNHRLKKRGWKLLGVPESPVEHNHKDDLKSFAKQMYGYGWSRGRLLKVKHIFTLLHALPSACLIFLILIFLTIPKAIALGLFGITTLCIVLLSMKKETLYFLVQQLSWAIGYFKGILS